MTKTRGLGAPASRADPGAQTLKDRETAQVADRHIAFDMFTRLFAGLRGDDSGGEQHKVEGFRREFAAYADGLSHRGQIG
jgi:hypothetical protein